MAKHSRECLPQSYRQKAFAKLSAAGPDDAWPNPSFNPGPPKHLHAIGVIAITFAQLESATEELFFDQSAKLQMPSDLSQKYFYALDELKKSEAIKLLFSENREGNEKLRRLVGNLLDCLEWARDCRNQLLHSEMHPVTAYFKERDHLYLTKRISKRQAEAGYMFFDLDQLRLIAERIRSYVVRSIELKLFLRYRDIRPDLVDARYKKYTVLPAECLQIPGKIKMQKFPVMY